MTGNPDPAHYEALVRELLDLQRREMSLDALTASIDALAAVFRFLNADDRLALSEATKALGRLLLALHDRRQGAKPKLFFDAPDRRGAKGPPSYTSSMMLRAIVNAAFLNLLEAGISQKEASRWLEAKLKSAGIKQRNGKVIDAGEIERWRAERGGQSLRGSDQTLAEYFLPIMRQLQVEYPQEHSDASPRKARTTAAVFIKWLRIAGF
jgi:hypothetical protein